MGKLLLVIVLFLAALMAGAVFAFQTWGWAGLGGAVLVLVGLVFGIKAAAGAVLRKIFMSPFLAKGAVLRDAAVQVHSVVPAPEPELDLDDEDGEEEEEDDEPDEPRQWLYVDLTITPKEQPAGAFTYWEPGELLVAGPDEKSVTGLDQMDEANSPGDVAEVRVWEDGKWLEDEGMKYSGERRLRLHVGLKPGTRRFRIRYYLDVFGEVEVPPALSAV